MCTTALCALLFTPATAAAGSAGATAMQTTPQATPAATPAPPPDDSPKVESSPTPQPNLVQQIVRHTITFSASSLIDAITEAFVELCRKSMDGAVNKVLPAMDSSMVWLTEVDDSGLSKFPKFEAAVRGAWSAMLKVALVLAPLVLALAVLAILGGGGSAVEARAETIAQVLKVLVSYAGAAASFYLLSLGVRASWGLTAFIWSVDLGVQIEPARVMLGGVITSVSAYFLGMSAPLFSIYLLFFFVFTVLALLGALGLALAATTALLVLGVIIAPLMIALGSIPQFRWLTWTWTRLMTGLLLLPVVNATMLKVASLMNVTMLDALAGDQMGSALLSFFVVAGSLSLVIAINYKVGHLVFGPVLEVHRRALGATKAVAVLAAAGAAVALGGPGVLKVGLGLGGGLGSGQPLAGGGGGSGSQSGGGRGSPINVLPGARGAGPALPPKAASAALSALAGMSSNPAVRGALVAAAQGFHQAAISEGKGAGAAGGSFAVGLPAAGGVYSVSTRDAARAVLGEQATPETVRGLAGTAAFQRAVRSARSHAMGLEKAGIPFADQVREAGFGSAESYLGGLTFQVGHRHLEAALESVFPSPEGSPSALASGGPQGSVRPREVLAAMGRHLDELGGGGFPGAEGRMRLLKQAGWWSFNPPPSDPSFSRYARAFLGAGEYLAGVGEGTALAELERAVQQARGDPTKEITPAEHMARIQSNILAGDFGEHQEALARFFEPIRRGFGS